MHSPAIESSATHEYMAQSPGQGVYFGVLMEIGVLYTLFQSLGQSDWQGVLYWCTISLQQQSAEGMAILHGYLFLPPAGHQAVSL